MSAFGVLKYINGHPLTSDRKLSALLRFAKWQIGSRLVPGAVSFDWVGGTKLLVRSGETGLTGNVYAGLDEFYDMAFVLHASRKNDLFVDVGANLGAYTILACGAIGARGYAFEPVPATFQKLIRNVHHNDIDGSVQCRNVGIGRECGSITFTSTLDTINHVMAPGEICEATISVAMTTLDEALAAEAPTLMKIDVEGYEVPVLEGALNTLKKDSLNAIIVELNGSGSRYGFEESTILEMLFDEGFNTYLYDPKERALFNLRGKHHASGNTLFVRNESLVSERLRTAPKISVYGRSF